MHSAGLAAEVASTAGASLLHRAAVSVLLVALVAVVYAPSLRSDFVFDDRLLVLENELVAESPWDLSALLGPSVGARIGYRPLRTFSYVIDHRIGGGFEPFVFHLSNLAYHAATVLAVYALARALLGATIGALFAAAVFAVHPLGSEAVAYVSGRRDLLCALFAVLALRAFWWFLDRRVSAGGRITAPLVAAASAALAAVASKETALVLPLLAALLAVLHARRHPTSIERISYAMLGRVLLVVTAVALLLYAERFALAFQKVWDGPLAPQPALSLRVIGRYLWLAIWPVDLLADYRLGAYALPTAALDLPAAIAGAALVAAITAGVLLLLRGRVAGAGLLWFFVALLPVAQVVPYGEVIAEHNAYLPLVGFGLALGEGLDALAMRRRRIAIACAVVVVLALGARSFVRSSDWRDEITLWTATLEDAPGSLRARYNLGIALGREARLHDAERALASAVEADPRDVESLVALAEIRGRLGDYAGAARTARRAIEVSPNAPAYVALGWSWLGQGSPFAARQAFRKARRLDGASPDAVRGLRAARTELRSRRQTRTVEDPPGKRR